MRRFAIAIAYVVAVGAATWIGLRGDPTGVTHPTADPVAALPLFAYLSLDRRGRWIAGLLAAGTELAVRLGLGALPAMGLSATATTILQALAIFWLLQNWGLGRRLDSSLWGSVGFGVSVVVGTLSGAAFGHLLGVVLGAPTTSVLGFQLGWLSSAVGIAATLPFLLAWRHLPRPSLSWSRGLEAAGLAMVWALFVGLVAFERPAAGQAEIQLLLVPAFLWTAARFDLAWATLGNLGIVLFARELEVVTAASAGWAISQLAFLLLLVLASLCLAVLLREREAAFAKLERSEARMQAVLTSIPELVLRLDRDGRCLERLGASTLRRQDGQRTLETLNDLLPAKPAGEVTRVVQSVLADGRPRGVRAGFRLGATERWIEARVTRLQEDTDDVPSAIVSIRDVTDDRLFELREAEQSKARALRHLTGGVAHDFNNLLTTVIGNLDLLGEGLRHPEQMAAHADVVRAVARGRELTKRLLAYSERQPLQPRPVPLTEHLRETVARLRTVSGSRVRLDTSSIEADDSLRVSVDTARLEEALRCLVDNARDACQPHQEIRVRVDRRRMRDEPDEPERSFVRVAVEDDGEGMSRETVERACDPFFTTRGVGRTGLGLSMVRGFARQSGGHLSVSSTEGGGTQASLLLPAYHTPVVSEGPTRAGLDLMVLIADQDPRVRRLVCRHVMRLGYAPVEASTTLEVEAMLERNRSIALVVIDRDLLEASKPLSAALTSSGNKCLVLSQEDTGDLEAGLDHPTLPKPFPPGALSESLDGLLAQRPTTPIPTTIEDSWPPPEDVRAYGP